MQRLLISISVSTRTGQTVKDFDSLFRVCLVLRAGPEHLYYSSVASVEQGLHIEYEKFTYFFFVCGEGTVVNVE